MDERVTDQGAKRVALVVEGLPTLAKLILDALSEDDFACKVVLTHDGEQALDYLFGRGEYAARDAYTMPCVTLLDLSLPGLNGLGVLREMRSHKRSKLIPVVAFSSADEQQQEEASIVYSCGANSYIRKTPGFESFVEALREIAHYWCVLNEPPPTL
jgi:two-component system, response regulator